MTTMVDTSVWSLLFRRDRPGIEPEAERLRAILAGEDIVTSVGVILQEVLQGVLPAASRTQLSDTFERLELIEPERADYLAAADLHNHARSNGVQLGTVDALIAHMCIRHELTLLSADRDFAHLARHIPLRLWRPAG